MKRETISQGMGNIDPAYIQEAAGRIPEKKKTAKFIKFKKALIGKVIAAALAFCVLAGGAVALFASRTGTVKVYAQGTDEEITAAGAVLHTGTISDTGEMKGKPLIFYLSGKGIETVRFSCKNQQINFMDWTGKRDEYGSAQNFTVPYGEDESEYYYLTIDWVPNETIRELTDHAETAIATLQAKLREDVIVMEITFANGKTAAKAITVSLREDGTFFASCDDYKISEGDDFTKRADSQAIPRAILYAQGSVPAQEASGSGKPVKGGATDDMPQGGNSAAEEGKFMETSQPAAAVTDAPAGDDQADLDEARKAAQDYYAGTVFEVISLEVKSRTDGEIVFTVRASKGGVVQEPDRSIFLQQKDGTWKVVNEGY